MDIKTWGAGLGQPVEVKVWLGEFAAGAFAIDARDEHLNKVNPTATDSGLGYRTWTLPAVTGRYNCLLTVLRYATAPVFVTCSQGGQVTACYELLNKPPINEHPAGTFNPVMQREAGDGLTSFHLVIQGGL